MRIAALAPLVVATILACAPMASADNPDPSPAPEDQQSEDQQSGPDLPRLPTPNNPNKGARTGDLADKNCWVIDGVPTWNAPGTAPRAIGPGETAMPCYYVYGLQPH